MFYHAPKWVFALLKSSIPIYSVLAKELLFDRVRINLSNMYLIDKRQIVDE